MEAGMEGGKGWMGERREWKEGRGGWRRERMERRDWMGGGMAGGEEGWREGGMAGGNEPVEGGMQPAIRLMLPGETRSRCAVMPGCGHGCDRETGVPTLPFAAFSPL